MSGAGYTIYANGWNDTDEYSTDEVKTNKVWIDGKPIYRKCFYKASGDYSDEPLGVSNLERIVNMYGTTFRQNVWINIASVFGFANNAAVYLKYQNNSWVFSVVGQDVTISEIFVVFEYTKTTD